MEKKIIFGTLGSAVAGMVVATVIFMGILGSKAEKWMTDNADCLNEMNPVWWVVGSLVISLFTAILLHRFGVSTFKGGAIAGAWITFFIVLWYDVVTASTFKAFTWDWVPFDIIGNVITGAVASGVIGWIYGKMK